MILVLIPSLCLSGDYQLFIAEREDGMCQEEQIYTENGSCFEDGWRPICTPDQVIEDLKQYFAGDKPRIKVLVPAFGNGHLTFCSSGARKKVGATLREVQRLGTNRRGRHLGDFIRVNKF